MAPNKLCAGLLAAMAGGYLLRRQGLRWGATDAEIHKPLPGDEVVLHPMLETTHAMSIDAAAGEIWPWLVQMGYYRAGWYADPSWWDKPADEYLRSLSYTRAARAPATSGRRRSASQGGILCCAPPRS